MAEILHQFIDSLYPIVYKVFTSQLVQDFSHQQYEHRKTIFHIDFAFFFWFLSAFGRVAVQVCVFASLKSRFPHMDGVISEKTWDKKNPTGPQEQGII